MTAAKLDSQLCFALYSASNHLTNVYRPLLDPLDLTYTQFVVLMALWEQDNIPIVQLAEIVGLSKATMTSLLRRLEEKGMIERNAVAGDERQKNIALTDKGRTLSDQSVAITEQVFCATGLSKSQADEMIALCKRITNEDPDA